MYPNLFQFLKLALGVDQPPAWTSYINSFGFFVALAFIAAAYVLTIELRRKEKEGLLVPKEEKRVVGKPATPTEIFSNGLLGFVIGYKLLGIFFSDTPVNPQDYIFSTQGSLIGGLLLAAVFGGMRYWEKKKHALAKPEERFVRIWPHERVGDITIQAAVYGFLGAKLFDNLENWDRFIEDPIGNLLSPSGLTFYGGLICAAAGILWYARRKNIPWKHLVDATAPALMLAYAIGRIGCQVAGDGDWGIPNSAYLTTPEGQVQAAASNSFQEALQKNSVYYLQEFDSLQAVPHAAVKAPGFLPDWMFAYSYPHNVNKEGFQISQCEGDYCTALPIPVFPTPLYETLMCLAIFGFLWYFRRRWKIPATMFAVYLILNGVERFLIEKIRVNNTYSLFGFHPTQAEIISFFLVISGILLLWWARSDKKSRPARPS